jgi:hypothetical protein
MNSVSCGSGTPQTLGDAGRLVWISKEAQMEATEKPVDVSTCAKLWDYWFYELRPSFHSSEDGNRSM